MKERNIFKIVFLCVVSLFLFCACELVTNDYSIICEDGYGNCNQYDYDYDEYQSQHASSYQDDGSSYQDEGSSHEDGGSSNQGNDSEDPEEGEESKPSEWYVDKDYGTGKWVYHKANSEELRKYYSSALPFAEYVPEKAKSSGDSLPLIIWLHGLGELMYNTDDSGTKTEKCPHSYCLLSSSFASITKNWGSTGLKNIPAILMAPHLETVGWGNTKPVNTIKAMIKYAKDTYNIDTNKVVLIGHSHGGYGVSSVYLKNQNLFSAIVIMSGAVAQAKPSDVEALNAIPLKGYTERGSVGASMESYFKSIGRAKDLTIYSDAGHGQVPKKALTEDKNGDKISDLIYWALSQSRAGNS